MGEEELNADDRKRECAMAATPLLQPNFTCNSISQHQLDKLKELRSRRLQIKNSDVSTKKKKGKLKKGGEKRRKITETGMLDAIEKPDQEKNEEVEVLHVNEDVSAEVSEDQAVVRTRKKRRKLHWGLDTKERWERKGNM